jgi:cytochrome c peroxidase
MSLRFGRLLCCIAPFVLSACQREATVTRLEAVSDVQATATAVLPINEDLNPRLLRRFAPIPRAPSGPDTPLVHLGRMLYFEPLLSRTGKVSCNSCHPLDRYGTTNTRFSAGVDGKPGRRNAPTVYNTVGHMSLFWDGRAPTLADQAIGPLTNPTEMGMKAAGIVRALQDIPGYQPLFQRAFPHESQPISIGNVAAALAEFERGLMTPSRWDRYLEGDKRAITDSEKEGVKLFANLGCMVCHTGAYVGGTMFEKLGVFVPWPNQSDHGRREVTNNPADDMVFKVPSLRNVARTAPYFHDGSAASLDTAVRMMAHHQLGVDLTEEEARSIVAWLGSLTGEIPSEYIAAPVLPPATRQ